MILATLLKKESQRKGLLRLQFQFSTAVPFQPGQFFSFLLNEDEALWRAYSVSASKGDKFTFEVALMNGGKGSAMLERMQVGRVLQVMGPYGNFTFEQPHPDGKVYFICTNTGVSPFVSMTLSLPSPSSLDISLIYGMKKSDFLLYPEVWKNAGVKVYPFVSHEHFPSPPFQKGTVMDMVKGIAFTPQDSVYICGNPNMVYDVSQWISNRFQAKVKIERYL